MNLNRNNFSAKLYRWFYNVVKEKMPSNLCPYFWKLLTAYVFSIPLIIITLPFEIFFGKFGKYNESIGERLWVSFVIWVICFFASSALTSVSVLFGYWPEENTFIIHIIHVGLLVWGLAVCVGLLIPITYIIKKIREPKPKTTVDDILPKEKKPNIVVEFVKAKYNRYCPKIDWND